MKKLHEFFSTATHPGRIANPLRKSRASFVAGVALALILGFAVEPVQPQTQPQPTLCQQLQPCVTNRLDALTAMVQDLANVFPVGLLGSRRKITFTNNEAGAVFDIHIEFDQPVTIEDSGDFEEYENDGTNQPNLYDDEGDAGIAAGGTLTIIVRGANNARPRIKRWWWTDRNHKQVGDIKKGDPGT